MVITAHPPVLWGGRALAVDSFLALRAGLFKNFLEIKELVSSVLMDMDRWN
jgi:hypothetical protein